MVIDFSFWSDSQQNSVASHLNPQHYCCYKRVLFNFLPLVGIKIFLFSSILHSINLLVKEVFVHHSANVQQGVSHAKEQIWAATPEVKISNTLKSTDLLYYNTLLEFKMMYMD